MKAPLKKLTDLIAKAEANGSELQRHKDLLEAAKLKRDKLIASGLVEDAKTRTAIADCDLDCRMLPHRIAQYEAAGVEIEKLIAAAGVEVSTAVHDEAIRLDELLQTRGLKRVLADVKRIEPLRGEALQNAALAVMSFLEWPRKLVAAQQAVRGIPARAVVGYAEELMPVIAEVEKFCA